MITHFSQQISNLLCNNLDLNEEKREELAYGFELIFLYIIGTFSILIVSFFLNALIPTVLVLFFGSVLRKLSGGSHASSALKCLIIGTFIYGSLGVLSKYLVQNNLFNPILNAVVLLVCIIIVTILAPVDCPAKPIHSQSFKTKLKLASVAFIAITLVIIFFSKNILLGTSAALGIAFQTVTLLPLFNSRKGG